MEKATQQIRVYPSDYPRLRLIGAQLDKKHPQLVTFLLDFWEQHQADSFAAKL